jgi:small subunit ribosomal protein S8
MAMSDPIGDMITRIRNALMRNKSSVTSPSSKTRIRILEVLKNEGYIRGFSETVLDDSKKELKIELKYRDGESVIQEIHRVSKPGRRVYSTVDNLPLVYNGLGMSIVSTSKGVMSDSEARRMNASGEIICKIF